MIDQVFEESLSYEEVLVDGSHNVGMLIYDDSETKDDKKSVLKIGSDFEPGNIIDYQSSKWISLIVDNISNMRLEAKLQKCVSSLKWLNSNGDIIEAFFCYENNSSPGLGVDDGRVISMGDTIRNIIIPSNIETRKISLGSKFIFDGRAWNVIKFDQMRSTGLIYLTLEMGLINSSNDNVELRISDYWINIHTYSVSILNGSVVDVYFGDTIHLNISTQDVKGGTVVSTDVPVIYTSSNESIATVSANGLVQTYLEGEAVITVSIVGHPEVNTSINLNVLSTALPDNFSIVINGVDNFKYNLSQTYTAVVYNNSIVDSTKTVVWSLQNDAMTGTTDLAQITSQNGTTCILKGIKYVYPSYVRLIATCETIPLTVDKRINIKPLY
ncbi:Ig-like domain-containing protein [Paenibacillus tianjinensis]|uniref:Ig-like domain (Group 2) n=1 Tax=Paenibacillus tianjinensis TaxID=2810347 RepID=A0ABX7L987_9BACL|nr:hypothetical protein [Paenibacillus tianjinensis]QSF43273.1 hypothetical protein JRJ22_18575 [Paenibacillus tianjinensis]